MRTFYKLLCVWLIAQTLISTNIAAKTLYVSQVSSQNPTATNTFRSLNKAVKLLKAGDKLIIGKGTYREAIELPSITWNPQDPVIIESEIDTHPTVLGSDLVANWENLGDGLFVKYNWVANSQQVFVNDQSLQQIGGTIYNGYPTSKSHPMAKLHGEKGIWPGRINGDRNGMTTNSFFYDSPNKNLYIKLAPNDTLEGKKVEVSVRPYLLFGENVDGLIIKGIEFRHSNTSSISYAGAVTLRGNNILIDNLKFHQVDSIGLNVKGNDNIIQNSVANYCGQLGMTVKGKRNRLTGNETSYNNTRGFNKSWEAGGAKFVGQGGLQDSEVSGHRAFFNQGDGIWFDWLNRNNRIHDNVLAYNTGFGIHYEASESAFIYNNYVFGNGQRGIYLPQSSSSLIAHNLVAGNGGEGIVIIDDGRRAPEVLFDFVPKGNKIIGNLLAWNKRDKADLVQPEKLFDNTSDYNFYVTEREQPFLTLGWPSLFKTTPKSLRDWSARTNQDSHSWHVKAAMPNELKNALTQQKLDINWHALLDMSIGKKVEMDRVKFGFIYPDNTNTSLTPGPFLR